MLSSIDALKPSIHSPVGDVTELSIYITNVFALVFNTRALLYYDFLIQPYTAQTQEFQSEITQTLNLTKNSMYHSHQLPRMNPAASKNFSFLNRHANLVAFSH